MNRKNVFPDSRLHFCRAICSGHGTFVQQARVLSGATASAIDYRHEFRYPETCKRVVIKMGSALITRGICREFYNEIANIIVLVRVLEPQNDIGYMFVTYCID